MSLRRLMAGWKRLLSETAAIVLPRHCEICRRTLQADERHICNACFRRLPFTGWHGKRGNVAERIFWMKIPIVRANAFLRYHAGSDSTRPAIALKYKREPHIGIAMGRIMATDLINTDFFEDIDLILPLPLSRKRERHRGYNQSEELARGVSQITGLPVDTRSLRRIVDNPTQTRLTPGERQENVKNIFRAVHPEQLENKHILLIDDVLTTGATLLSAAQELVNVPGIRFSVLALYIAGNHPYVPLTPDEIGDYQIWKKF